MFRAFEHRVENGSARVMVLWNDAASEMDSQLTVASEDYRFPAHVNLFDLNDWQDVAHEKTGGGSVLRLKVGSEPTIVRMFHQN